MDNFTDLTSMQPDGDQSEIELSHFAKLTGIFIKPGKTFEKISKSPPRTIDWFIPVIIQFALILSIQFYRTNNSQVNYQFKQKQIEIIQKSINQSVERGLITKAQADDQINKMRNRISVPQAASQIVPFYIVMLFFLFVFFFFMAGVYYLVIIKVLKGEGEYRHVLVATGLSAYITIFERILAITLTLILGKPIWNMSIASFLSSDLTTIRGFIFSYLDIFHIWGYIVLSIGLAKLFKSSSLAKYYFTVFGIWILGGLLSSFYGKVIPHFLSPRG
jgi:hypothetical protein